MSTFNNNTEMNTRLTSLDEFNPNNVVFGVPMPETNKSGVKSYVIRLGIKNPDGTVGDLVLDHEKVFSYGVSENLDKETGTLTGYVLPLCLWNRSGPTEYEVDWIKMVEDQLVHAVKAHLVENREQVGEYTLEYSDMKKMNPFWYKREQGKIVEGKGPVLYGKLIYSRKSEKILTKFYDTAGKEVDPMSLLKKYCHVTPAIKFESIYIGAKISIRVKLYECVVEVANTGFKSLLTARIQQDDADEEEF
jgi:hypothetical protein